MQAILPPLETTTLLVVITGLLVAGIVKGATGLGYSSCALPFLVYALDLKTAIALVLLPAMATNVVVALGNGYLRASWRDYAPLYLATLPGIAAGVALLAVVDHRLAVHVLGMVVIAYAVFALMRPQLTLSNAYAQALQIPVGLANGVLTGLTGSQMMPMVPYFLATELEPARMVQAINLGVLLASAALLVGLVVSRQTDNAMLILSLLAIAPALTGVEIGRRIQSFISAAMLRTLILVVLAIAGAGLVLR